MLNRFCEPDHLIIIILVLLVALLVVGAGKGGGKLLLQLLKKVFGHEEVNINLGGGDMAKDKKDVVNPEFCRVCQAEHERSTRNESEITKLWEHYGKLGEEMRTGFKDVQTCITESQKVIITALGSRSRGK